jgi:hypothetical protein
MADSTQQLLEDILVADVLILASQIVAEAKASDPQRSLADAAREAIARIKAQRGTILQLLRDPPPRP